MSHQEDDLGAPLPTRVYQPLKPNLDFLNQLNSSQTPLSTQFKQQYLPTGRNDDTGREFYLPQDMSRINAFNTQTQKLFPSGVTPNSYMSLDKYRNPTASPIPGQPTADAGARHRWVFNPDSGQWYNRQIVHNDFLSKALYNNVMDKLIPLGAKVGAFGALGAVLGPEIAGAGVAGAGGGAGAGAGGGGAAAGGYATSPGWVEPAISSSNIGAGGALGGGGLSGWLGGNSWKSTLLNTGVNLIESYFNNKAISDANAANQKSTAQRIRQALEQMDPAHIQALVNQYLPEIMAIQNPAGQSAIQAMRERAARSGRPIDDTFAQTSEAGLRGQLANAAASQAFQNAISTAQGNQSAITGTPIPQQQVVPGYGGAIQDTFNQLLAARYVEQLRNQQGPYNYNPGSTVMYQLPGGSR